MASWLDTLRRGVWLTRERMRRVALMVLAAAGGGLIFLAVTAHGAIDFKGRPLGTDFSSFYAAGTLVVEGHALATYDQAAHYAREQTLFGPATPYYAWLYPPYFLLLVGLLALLPYLLALVFWQAASLAGYLAALRLTIRAEIVPPATAGPDRLWLLLAVAYPPVLINIGHGQNGLLTAALLAAALAALPRRPVMAGILFGLLVYKPQFGLLIPLALAAGGCWRTILAAVLTVALLTAVTTTAFGIDVWPAFMASARVARTALLELGEAGWYKEQSVFGWVRMWGGSVDIAYVIQGAVTIVTGIAIVWLWRSSARYPLKAAGLAVATIAAALHSDDYDLLVLAPAIACFAVDGMAHGFRPYEKTILAAVWFMPLVARSVAENTAIPLGTMSTLGLLVLIVCKAADGRSIQNTTIAAVRLHWRRRLFVRARQRYTIAKQGRESTIVRGKVGHEAQRRATRGI